MIEAPRLNEYTEDEWFEVCRQLRPELTREEFEQMWDDFQEFKQRKSLN